MRMSPALFVIGMLCALAPQLSQAERPTLADGQWELTRWREGTGDRASPTRVKSKQCWSSASLGDAVLDASIFDPAIDVFLANRVTLDRDRRVQEYAGVWDFRSEYDLPWMSSSRGGMMLVTVRDIEQGDHVQAVRWRVERHYQPMVHWVPTAAKADSEIVGIDLRRLGDCPSGFRFMKLRELWRSIFQWWP